MDFGVSELKINVKNGLAKYVKILVDSSLKAKAIILMGSRARGDWKTHSDTDIVVIAENLPKDHGELLVALNPPEVWGISIEPRAYTPEDFMEAIWALDLTALDAMHEGVVLYDDGFWEESKKAFRTAKKEYRLKKIKNGWIALEPL